MVLVKHEEIRKEITRQDAFYRNKMEKRVVETRPKKSKREDEYNKEIVQKKDPKGFQKNKKNKYKKNLKGNEKFFLQHLVGGKTR